jgi:hypothetical protein
LDFTASNGIRVQDITPQEAMKRLGEGAAPARVDS